MTDKITTSFDNIISESQSVIHRSEKTPEGITKAIEKIKEHIKAIETILDPNLFADGYK